MNRFTFCLLMGLACVSCDVSHGPYLKSKVEIREIASDCAAQSQQFSMNSNIIGERYVFQECLHPGAVPADVRVERSNDTVFILTPAKGSERRLYELTVDVNTQPRYNWIRIGNSTIPIVPAGN